MRGHDERPAAHGSFADAPAPVATIPNRGLVSRIQDSGFRRRGVTEVV